MRSLGLALTVLLVLFLLHPGLISQSTAPKKPAAGKKPPPEVPLPKGDTFVDELTLTGLTKLAKDEQQKIIDDVEDHQYPRTDLNQIRERVLYDLQTRGYYKAKVSDPQIKVLSQTPRREVVAATLNVSEGELYRLQDINFTNTRAVSPLELRQQFPLQNGDIFDMAKIQQGLDGIRRLYASKGYGSVTAVPSVRLDEAAHTVSLSFDLEEGSTAPPR